MYCECSSLEMNAVPELKLEQERQFDIRLAWNIVLYAGLPFPHRLKQPKHFGGEYRVCFTNNVKVGNCSVGVDIKCG